ncbi:hypothetical protein CHRY9293_02918 [Chryseobacterium potabilaquae]|uniref:Uncharacterized protein n=1 Tax=Chryseobacterium potabilaquae TaxID=2675057 RepID=A0A6N4XCV5_9FLAO|nr:hypothetical protein CHRY9293_02918 [Chryseobacterium potabilaquae]
MNKSNSYHHQIQVFSSFEELVHTPFKGKSNAFCWHRNLEGDFKEIVSQLQLKENITEVSTKDLLSLSLSKKGDQAREILLNDLQLLTDQAQNLGGYAKSLDNLNKKKALSFTPLSCNLKFLIFALKDSAEALVLLLSK